MVCPDMKIKKKANDEEEGQNDNEIRELYEECCREVDRLDTKVVF